MGTKRHKLKDGAAELRQADVLIAQGVGVAEAIRAIGASEVTSSRWRKEFGRLKTDQVRRMKELEVETERLRKTIADLTLDKLILQEAVRGPQGQCQQNFRVLRTDAPAWSTSCRR